MTDRSDRAVNEATSVREWWAANPMTYAPHHGATTYLDHEGNALSVHLGSREFFEVADRTFYSWNAPLHSAEAPFGRLFDYPRYRARPVLEIGCGMGCMAMNWAQQGARVVATDLNPVAVAQTRRRLDLFGLPANVVQTDARRLPFPADSFEYAYSWGVLHHSSELEQSIGEIRRVLRPGGRLGVMLYNRHSILYRYRVRWLEGFLNLESEFLNPLELASRYGDGAKDEGNPHTWPVTVREAREELFGDFTDVQVDVFGTELDASVRRFLPRLAAVATATPFFQAVARRWGWSLWITARRA